MPGLMIARDAKSTFEHNCHLATRKFAVFFFFFFFFLCCSNRADLCGAAWQVQSISQCINGWSTAQWYMCPILICTMRTFVITSHTNTRLASAFGWQLHRSECNDDVHHISHRYLQYSLADFWVDVFIKRKLTNTNIGQQCCKRRSETKKILISFFVVVCEPAPAEIATIGNV